MTWFGQGSHLEFLDQFLVGPEASVAEACFFAIRVAKILNPQIFGKYLADSEIKTLPS